MNTITKVLVTATVVALVGAPTAHADPPDLLAGITVAPYQHRYDYRRAAFGEGWGDDGDGCDLLDDVLDRDLVDKTYVSVKRCPDAVFTGTLNDPYTGKTIAFTRGARSSEAVQIDHLVSAAPMQDTPIHSADNVDDMPLLVTRQLAASSMSGERAAHLDMS
jgi:hypothetical protein